MKGKRGITLISLVVTIIVLIILAMVSINLVFDTNLIDRVASAKEINEIESIIERLDLVKGSMYLDNEGKGNIDTYFISLNKEKINPYILTKIVKITDELGIVEVDNKYSFLIKFENDIKIEYEGKIEEIKRKEPVIEVIISGLKEKSDLPVELTAEIKADGEKVTSGKWVLNQENGNIGIDESLYTENILEDGSINLEIQETGENFLHIITTDVFGITKETIKGPITVIQKYHTHTGSEGTVVDGCYTKPVKHKHNSACDAVCTIRVYSSKSLGSGCYCCGKSATRTEYSFSHGSCGAAGGAVGVSVCGSCGTYGWNENGFAGSPSVGYTEKHTYRACGKNTNTIEKYDLGCGKTEETKEGYVITY